ncbi:MAG: sulfatase [Kiritimatiellales bacterium]
MKQSISLAAIPALAAAVSQSKPLNIIVILADDFGWSDTTLYGTTDFFETPNIERLAARGMTFTHAYSASPLCSPTRASILTGQTPARNGSTAPNHHLPEIRLEPEVAVKGPAGDKARQCVTVTRLDTAFPTLGKLIKAKGYRTAHFGKWHLGAEPYSPLQHGFDVDIPHWPGPGPAGSFIAPWKFPAFKEKKAGEHIEDRMAAEAVAWIRSVASRPFYMNYWQFSVHAPFDAKDELIEKYRHKIDRNNPQNSPTYAAMVHSLDDAVGSLLDEVDRLGIADRTIIIFYSDNGGNMYNGIEETDSDRKPFVATPTSNAPLRGGKATIFEGGIRVPCVVVWPGVTAPGSRCDARIQSTDLYPFILNALGISLPKNYSVDGVDFSPALRGEAFDRGPMFTFFPHTPAVPDWLPPSVAVHAGDWKLIRLFHQGKNGVHDYLLFNLADDIGEKNNLATAMPEKVHELDKRITDYLAAAGAVVPLPNPDFDPSKYRPQDIGVQKGGLKLVKKIVRTGTAVMPPEKVQTFINGWEARPGDTLQLAMEDGALAVYSTGGDPWVKTVDIPNIPGPFVLEMEICPAASGTLQVFAAWNGRAFERGSGIDYKVSSAGKWVTIIRDVPSGGVLTALRIDPPGTAGKSLLRNIRLKNSSGKILKEWFVLKK